MGTGDKGLLLYYLCIPVANYVAIMVDFWGCYYQRRRILDEVQRQSKVLRLE